MKYTPPLSLEDAQARLLNLASTLPVEHVDVEGSFGRYLAAPLRASRTQPAADLSAMDGYTVIADDLNGPWQVVGESAAGHPYDGDLQTGETVRISTGAILPKQAGAVIIQENVDRQANQITLTGSPPFPADLYVRHCGLDFGEGGVILAKGTYIGPAQAALATAAGHTHLPVHAAPKVTIIDSGDELSNDPECCALHQIPASNGLMVKAMVGGQNGKTTLLDPVPDQLEALMTALNSAKDADVVVISGGASVGDHDLIRPALDAIGASVDFWRVAIKPGKPLLVATRPHPNPQLRGNQIILGLPGNPVSTFVTAYHFLLPLLRHLQGASSPFPAKVTAQLTAALPATMVRREFVRAQWDGHTVTPHPVQDSSALVSLATCNALIDRPPSTPPAQAGNSVTIFLLHNGGFV